MSIIDDSAPEIIRKSFVKNPEGKRFSLPVTFAESAFVNKGTRLRISDSTDPSAKGDICIC